MKGVTHYSTISSQKMRHVDKDFRFSGFTSLVKNNTGEYIVYEQIINNNIRLPITQGLLRFHFVEGYRRPHISHIDCFQFVQDYSHAVRYGFKRMSILEQELHFDKVITNEFIRQCISNNPGTRYQFIYY